MKHFLCELLFLCTVATPGAKPLDELAYGTVLFDYFQDDYPAALLQTMIAEEREWLGEDPVRFDLAKGSFAFADGMYGYARAVFEAIPEGELSDIDEMRLAFHLAREYHRRQSWGELDAQIAKIDLGKSWFGRERVHPEVEYMRAEAALHQGAFAEAEAAFERMAPENPLRAYGLYNLGVSYRERGDLESARKTFRGLSKMPAYSDEAWDLAQRSRLALALIAQEMEKPAAAERVLSDLPSRGRYQDVAMATYGTLAMESGDYPLAARIWMTLQEQQHWSSSTAAARLGFPMSIERMAEQDARATTQMALVQYQLAEQKFDARLASISQLQNRAQDPAWVRGLLEAFTAPVRQGDDGPDSQALRGMMQQWETELGHTDWLEWLATDEVHQALTQWRDLNDMQRWLDALPNRTDALQEVAAEQRRRGEAAGALLHGAGLVEQRAAFAAKADAMAGAIQRVHDSEAQPNLAWMLPLATAEERELLQELAQMQGLVRYMNPLDQQKWQARIGRLRGVVFYQIVDSQAERERGLQRQHNELVKVLTEVDERIARVAAAEEQFVAGVGRSFAAFGERAMQVAQQVTVARERREQRLASEIRERLDGEEAQLQEYLLVTRIAIARATDQLAQLADASAPGADIAQERMQ